MFEAMTRRVMAVTHGGVARFTLPPVIYEIAPDFVAGYCLEGSGRQARKVRSLRLAALQAQTLGPHLSHANVANAADLQSAAEGLVGTVGNGGGRYGLVLPDGAVRVAILTFETLPGDPQEADALIRWKMKDKLPYSPEEARTSFQVLAQEVGHLEVLAVAVRATVLAEYEAAWTAANGGPALILPATVALLPLLPDAGGGGQLLLHVCSNWVTAVAIAGSRPCVWRTRELDATAPETHARDAASEAVRVLASARDRMQADLSRAWLCARPTAGPEMVAAISSAVGRQVELVKPGVELSVLLSPDSRETFMQFGAPIAGLVANAG
jgi:hypothetical protein